MTIDHLAEHVDVIPTLALWILKKWGHLHPGWTLDKLIQSFNEKTHYRQIPETFVAMEDDIPVGTASIVHHDMSIRMELSPWLAAVYVSAESRNKGIGSQLTQTVMEEAKIRGIKKFYLFTPDKMNFYRRLGWQILEETEYLGEHVTIMYYELSDCYEV